MTSNAASTDQAWGIELDGGVTAARVVRSGGRYRLEDLRRIPPVGAAGPHAWATAMRALCPCLPEAPVAVAIADEQVLHRSLTLPRADRATLEKIVANQAQVLLPAGAQTLAWAWGHYADPFAQEAERVILCAARKDLLVPLAASPLQGGKGPAVIVPSSIALAEGLAALGAIDDDACLLRLQASASTVVIVHRGKVLHCAAVEHEAGCQGPGRWSARARLIREAYEDCVADVPRQQRPRRILLLGSACRQAGVAEALAEAVPLAAAVVACPSSLTLSDGASFAETACAIAAAAAAMQGRPPLVNLSTPDQDLPRRRAAIGWRLPAAASWCVLAILGLYWLDCHRAGKVGQALRDAQSRMAAVGPLDRQQRMAQYLIGAGVPALQVLDEISSLAPAPAVLSTWRYARTGEVTLGGTVASDADLQQFLQKLAKSPYAQQVQAGNVKMDQGKLRFEVTFLAKARPGAASQPASAPASPPAAGAQPPSPVAGQSPSPAAPKAAAAVEPAEAVPSQTPAPRRPRMEVAPPAEESSPRPAAPAQGAAPRTSGTLVITTTETVTDTTVTDTGGDE